MLFYSVSLTSKSPTILFGRTSHPNQRLHISSSNLLMRSPVFDGTTPEHALLFTYLLSFDCLCAPARSEFKCCQKTMLICVLTISTAEAETCDDFIAQKSHRAAFCSSAPSHLQMAEGDVEVKAAFEILRQAPGPLPFIQDTPLLARALADVLHLSCWVTFVQPSQV